jgi:hypothetical protein
VAEAILKLSNPRYFYRPYIRHGFVRGYEPFNYVRDIMARWRMYEEVLEAVATRRAAAEGAVATTNEPKNAENYGENEEEDYDEE